MTFAAITPALIVGALVERMKFSAMALFLPLWLLLVYCPIAHMVWYWAGPDAIDAAAKALAAAADGAAKTAAQAKLDEVNADAGLIFQWGAIDFAGGTVVHINSGIAGLVGALLLGKRIGFGKELMPPHSLTLNMIGAALLWVGWFGFNAGSNLEASGGAVLAMTNSFVATAARGARMDGRRVDGARANPRCSVSSPARSRASSPSRRPPAMRARWARSCSASSPAWSASSSARR